MKSTKKTKKTSTVLQNRVSFFKRHFPHVLTRRGFWAGALFLFTLFVLSVFSGLSFNPGSKVFIAGEIASETVTANRDLLVEDFISTQSKQQQVANAQPPIFDLNPQTYVKLEERVKDLLITINDAPLAQMDQIRWEVAESLDTEIGKETFHIWRNEDVQNLVLGRVLPWLKEKLEQGIVSDLRILSPYEQGILVRNLGDQTEIFRENISNFQDISRLEGQLESFLRNDLKRPLRMRKAVYHFIAPLIRPSLTMNREETEIRREDAMESVEPVYYRIAKNEVIVRQGERVEESMQLKLQALAQGAGETVNYFKPLGIFLLSLLLASGLVLASRGKLIQPLSPQDFVLLSFLFLLFGAMAKGMSFVEAPLMEGMRAMIRDVVPLALPLAGAAGVLALFFPLGICYSACLLLTFFCCQIFGAGLGLFAFYFGTCLVYVNVIKRAETRPQVLKSVIPLLGTMLIAWSAMVLIQNKEFTQIEVEAAFVMGGGLVSLMVVLALSPVVELLFGYTSRFKLMELMNLEQPLLQDLMVAVPGTYHHSLIVANMVEAGARAIGANALLCKVAALYHDIGKIKNPQYFIENLFGGKNKHDKLAPSMSALILISHVKKGVELAMNHKLGREITDIIRQHHGTSVISFFYHKAMGQAAAKGGEAVRVEDYSYPGPKPQTREAGIVLLADAIEASSRALVDPTPSRIKGHIESMIKKIFSEGQLDESELTFKDLHILGETFHRILASIFHQRIPYPGVPKEQPKPERPAAEDGALAGNGEDRPPVVRMVR